MSATGASLSTGSAGAAPRATSHIPSHFERRLRGGLAIGTPLVLGVIVALPLVLLLINSFNVGAPGREAVYSLQNWARAFSDVSVLQALWNSVALGATRLLISTSIALAMAWLIARSDMPGRNLLEVICWLGVFLPALPLTFGWMLLLDPQIGVVNQWLRTAGLPTLNIFSWWGIVWVHLATTSIVYPVILLVPAFRKMSASLEEAARVCGANQLTTTLRVTVPLLAPAVLGVAVLGFVVSLETFEVEWLLGKRIGLYVYSTRIYEFVLEPVPRYGEATALGFLFLVLLAGLAGLYQWYVRSRSFTTITGQGYHLSPIRLGKVGRWTAAVACFGWFAVTMLVPLVLLVLGSFMRRYGYFQIANPFTLSHWQNMFGDPVFLSSVQNTAVIATGAGSLSVVIYSLVAYAIVRFLHAWPTRLADLLMWVPWAVPGVLMSLGLLWLFLGTPLRTALYGTLLGLTLAMVIRSSPTATLFFKAGFHQVGRELEESARVSGASWKRTYVLVLLPLLAPTAVTVGLLTFMAAVRDIGTSVLLYSQRSRPLSIMMLEYSFAGEMERGMAIGVLITVSVLAITLGARTLGFRLARERE